MKNLTITSPTTATATISVSPTAPVGGNSVVMITGSEIESGAGFTVTPSAAQILSILPPGCSVINSVLTCNGVSLPSGSLPWQVMQLQTSTLNIVGQDTHWLQGETSVSFGSGVAVDSLTVTSPTTATVQITVLSGSPVGYATLTTYTDGETVTLPQAIDIEQGFPTLLATTPSGAQQGNTLNLQILGRFTHWQQGGHYGLVQPGHHGECLHGGRFRQRHCEYHRKPTGFHRLAILPAIVAKQPHHHGYNRHRAGKSARDILRHTGSGRNHRCFTEHSQSRIDRDGNRYWFGDSLRPGRNHG